MARAPQPPNQVVQNAQIIANEFLKETNDETVSRYTNLVSRNLQLGGSDLGYVFKGIPFLVPGAPKHEYVPEIHPTLERDAEAHYLRAQNLDTMRTKLAQALSTIHLRCKDDIQVFRDALPDAFVEVTQLAVYRRQRPQHYYLKAYPMLTAPYRVIDEAILFRDRYRLLG